MVRGLPVPWQPFPDSWLRMVRLRRGHLRSRKLLRHLLQRHRPVPQRLEHFGDLAGHHLSSSLLPESISTGRRPSTELSQCNQASRCCLICSNVLRLRLPHSGIGLGSYDFSRVRTFRPGHVRRGSRHAPRGAGRRIDGSPTSIGMSTKIPSTCEYPAAAEVNDPPLGRRSRRHRDIPDNVLSLWLRPQCELFGDVRRLLMHQVGCFHRGEARYLRDHVALGHLVP